MTVDRIENKSNPFEYSIQETGICERILRKIQVIIFETLSIIKAALLYIPLGFYNDNPRTVTTDGINTPIIFVHGFLHNRAAWFSFKRFFQKKGHKGPLYTINLGSPFNSIHTYKNELAKLVKQVQQETKSSKVILVGHSMGGLVATQYALENPNHVEKIVTLGSPLQGTRISKLGKWLCKCVEEMDVGSAFIQNLESGMKKLKINMLCIASPSDEIVLPQSNAFPKLDSTFIEKHKIKYVGHVQLLDNGETMEKVIQFIHGSAAAA